MNEKIKAANKVKMNTVIKNLQRRNMNGYYCESVAEAKEKALSLIGEEDVVSWGGSVTLDQIGIKEELKNVIDTMKKMELQEALALRVKSLAADVFLTGTNAITMDGELVNIDATGNRVAAICFGPKKVIIFAGANKIAADEAAAISRVKSEACVPNVIRLGKKTPCAITGKCGNCLTPGETLCASTVVTRFSTREDRIHVILINENLGY